MRRVKAVFVDTDQVPACDSRVGDLVQNEIEAKLVYQVSFLVVCTKLAAHPSWHIPWFHQG